MRINYNILEESQQQLECIIKYYHKRLSAFNKLKQDGELADIIKRTSIDISLMEIQNDDQWRIVQIINVNIAGLRLRFTSGNEFVIQPASGDQLEVYSSDNGKILFQILQEVQKLS